MPAAHRNPHSLGAAALGLPAARAGAHRRTAMHCFDEEGGGQVLR